MSGTAAKQNISTTMVVKKTAKEDVEEISLEDKKRQLEVELAERQAEKEKLDFEIAEQQRKKKEQEERDLANEIKATEEEEAFLMDKAKHARVKINKLLAKRVDNPEPEKQLEEEFTGKLESPLPDFEERNVEYHFEVPDKINDNIPSTELDRPIPSIEDKEEEEQSRMQKVVNWIFTHLAKIQVAAFLLFFVLAWGGFYLVKVGIDKYNASLTDEQLITEKINGFNAANVQRVFFEKGIQGFDLAIFFLFLSVAAPTVLLYIVPFIKGPRNFSDEFINDLTPWQRSLVFCILFSALLLYLALSHQVNTF